MPIFDRERPIRSTGDMLPWYTGKACEHTNHSHINMCVFDSRWEASESLELDRSPNVALGSRMTISALKSRIHSKGSSANSALTIW